MLLIYIDETLHLPLFPYLLYYRKSLFRKFMGSYEKCNRNFAYFYVWLVNKLRRAGVPGLCPGQPLSLGVGAPGSGLFLLAGAETAVTDNHSHSSPALNLTPVKSACRAGFPFFPVRSLESTTSQLGPCSFRRLNFLAMIGEFCEVRKMILAAGSGPSPSIIGAKCME